VNKRKRRKRSSSQRVLWLLSLVIAVSMVFSLVIVALPSRPVPAPTPLPTFTPSLPPTASDTPRPTEPSPTLPPTPSPTPETTEPIIGPVLPTDTPVVSPTLVVTPTATATALPTTTSAPSVTVTALPIITSTATVSITAAGGSLEFSFAVCGDSRDNPQLYRKVLDAVMADGSEFLVHTGDLVNKGTEPLWQEFRETMAGFTLPFYPVAGNHDSLDGQLDRYLAYSGAPAAHYSFDRGPVHFSLADSHHGGISADELAWLRDDLSATHQPIKMVFLHHPPFDPDGTNHIMAYGNDKFVALMAEQQVDHVFAGHVHAYAQEERDGVIYTITGGAGAPLYRQDHPQAFHHYLRVTVRGEEVTIEVVKV
jgi:predicted phosphodiesterase